VDVSSDPNLLEINNLSHYEEDVNGMLINATNWMKWIEPLYHKGYNPAQSIESSVPIPKIKATNRCCTSKTSKDQILKTRCNPHINTSYEMRDLYHRKEKLAYWNNRANTELQEPDKTDVLNFL
jgi:hypothetical protein